MPPHHDAHAGAHRASRVPTWPALARTGSRLLATVTPAVALAAAAAFVGGAVTSVTVHQLADEHARDVRMAAAVQAQADRERSDAATAARLSAQATAYLSAQRTAARELAAGALSTADALTSASQGMLGPDEAAELAAAVAHLSSLLDEAPDARLALESAVSTVAAEATAMPTPEPTPAPTPSPVAPVEPLADVVALLDAQPSADGGTAPDTLGLDGDGVVLASAPVAAAAEVPHAATLAGPSRTEARGPLSEGVDSPGAADGASATPAPTEVLAVADLALTTSVDLASAAQRVLDLSAALQETVDQRIAERDAAAQAAAQAERERLAHETSSQRIKRLVAGAKAATPGQIPEEFLCDVPFDHAVRLRCDAAAALTLMDQAYRAETGRHLGISSSYRSTDEQTQLFLEKGAIAATPGTSNHERGQAIDLAGAGALGQFDQPLYLWLQANAGRFGWHHPLIMEPGGPGPLEPWHWEYDTQD